MTGEEISSVAARLLADYDSGQPNEIFAECGTDWLTLADAYRVQDRVAALRRARGECSIGWKVGCISAAVQRQFGIRQPVRGRLWDREAFPCGARLPRSRFAHLAVEGEIAVRLARDLSPGEENPGAGVECWFPVIELHNYRFGGDPPTVQELVAGNALHTGFVTALSQGSRCLGALTDLQIHVEADQVRVESAAVGAVPGGPLASLRWLTEALAETGETLHAGDVILTGSPGRLLPLNECTALKVTAGEHSAWATLF